MSALCVMCLDKIVTYQSYMRQSLFVNLPKYNWSHSTQTHFQHHHAIYGGDDSKSRKQSTYVVMLGNNYPKRRQKPKEATFSLIITLTDHTNIF